MDPNDIKREVEEICEELKRERADIWTEIQAALNNDSMLWTTESWGCRVSALASILCGALLGSQHVETRQRAARLLMLVPRDFISTESLIQGYEDESSTVRGSIILNLSRNAKLPIPNWEAEAEKLLVVFRKAIQDIFPLVRLYAIEGLRVVGIDLASEVVPELIAALKDTESAVRRRACSILAWLGSEAMPAVPTIVEMAVGSTDKSDCRAALFSLAEIHAADPRSLRYLGSLAAEPLQKVIRNLRRIGAKGRLLRKCLEEGLNEKDKPKKSLSRSPDKAMEARNAWIRKQRDEGRTLKEIRSRLKEIGPEKGWETLESDQGIYQAIKRHTKKRTAP